MNSTDDILTKAAERFAADLHALRQVVRAQAVAAGAAPAVVEATADAAVARCLQAVMRRL